MGAGVESKEEKSRSWPDGGGMGVVVALSVVGDPGSDSVDETERRFVRAGVRRGCAGGIFEELEELYRGGDDSNGSS